MTAYLTIRWSPPEQKWLVLDGETVVDRFGSLYLAEQFVCDAKGEDET